MTNAELIQKIRNEIERQQRENVNYDENGSFASYCDLSTWSALDSMLTFVSGLEESEKPMNHEEELEAEIQSFWNMASGHQPKFVTLEVKENGFATIARHFAKWGADHTPLPEEPPTPSN